MSASEPLLVALRETIRATKQALALNDPRADDFLDCCECLAAAGPDAPHLRATLAFIRAAKERRRRR